MQKGFGLVLLLLGVLVIVVIFGVFVAPQYFKGFETAQSAKQTVNEANEKLDEAKKAQEQANQIILQNTRSVESLDK